VTGLLQIVHFSEKKMSELYDERKRPEAEGRPSKERAAELRLIARCFRHASFRGTKAVNATYKNLKYNYTVSIVFVD
jgi:hypothetical protein